MKQILAILAAVALCASAAQAQQYAVATAYSSGTNTIATNGTVTNNFVIAATKVTDIGLAISARAVGAATGNITATFARSLDGTNWVSTPNITLAVAANGTNPVTAVTNITVGAVGFLRLNTVAYADPTSVLTNVSVTFSRKPRN